VVDDGDVGARDDDVLGAGLGALDEGVAEDGEGVEAADADVAVVCAGADTPSAAAAVRLAAKAPASAEDSVRRNPVRGVINVIVANTEMSRSE
jgi:hypothetical protein